MQFEDLNKKIREAADHHHPAYEEKAWEKMEKLLDKHLPQKKDGKRRTIFFILLFMLTGAGAWFFLGIPGPSGKIVSKPAQKGQPAVETLSSEKNQSHSLQDRILPRQDVSISNENHKINSWQENKDGEKPAAFDRNQFSQSVMGIISERLNKSVRANSGSFKKKNVVSEQQQENNEILQRSSGGETATIPSMENSKSNLPVQNSITPENDKVAADQNKTQSLTDSAGTKQPVEEAGKKIGKTSGKDKTEANKVSKSKKLLSQNKNKNYIFLSISAGPDLSVAGIKRPGQIKSVYGIGIGYSFHDKFSLRSGFYSVRKVYKASPDEYHLPYNFWTYYPYLEKVDADCRIFEIPLLLGYDFSHRNNHSIFGSAGLSSYFMKRETYDYISKLPSGQTTYKQVTFNNQNKHFFSVLTLSGGYKRKLGKSISITAEPYIKVPLDGIGFGKMQLNSAGVLFSLQLQSISVKSRK